jgi:hypothetical protein
VRQIDDSAMKRHSNVPFRLGDDYAVYDHFRRAKVMASVEPAGVAIAGRVPDGGCGRGMPVPPHVPVGRRAAFATFRAPAA